MEKNIEKTKEESIIKEKKKTIISSMILAIVALLLIGVFVVVELRENGVIGSYESSEIIKIFGKAYNSKDRKVIYYASSTCGYCELQKPILETIAEDYNIDYYAIDSNELSNKQREEILKKLDIEHATPTTVIVENGKVIATNVGYVDGGTLVKFFKENEVVPEDAVYSAEQYITFIDYNKYKSLIRSKERHIIVVGQTSCSHCIAIKPALNSVAADYNLTINYLNLTELTEEESNKFFESLEKIEYNDPDFIEDGSFGTPLTLIIENGKVQRYISGSRTISQLVREFTKAGLIKE